MNKIIILISVAVFIVFIHLGVSSKTQTDTLKNEIVQRQANNLDMQQEIKDKELLAKEEPVTLSTEYNVVMNQIKWLESYSGTNMSVQLEETPDTQDITSHYQETEYRGIRGLNIKIVVDKFSNETDMGAVLDDIHLLEMNTDFLASQIIKDKNNLIVKGEIYGL